MTKLTIVTVMRMSIMMAVYCRLLGHSFHDASLHASVLGFRA